MMGANNQIGEADSPNTQEDNNGQRERERESGFGTRSETEPPATPHPLNRHLFIADNYDLLRRLDSDSVDLVVTDPPFAKNDTFTSDGLKPPLEDEEKAAEREQMEAWKINNPREAAAEGIEWPPEGDVASYKDIWVWEKDVHFAWKEEIKETYKAVWAVLDAANLAHSNSHAAYLAYMAVRLIEIERVLKPTGSIYLHCDQDASHYLKLLMDAVFGKDTFVNEVVWAYSKWTNASNFFQKSNDVILFYGGEGRAFNKQFVMTEGKRKTLEKGYGSNVVEGGVRQLLVYDPDKVPERVLSDPKYHRVVNLSDKPKGVAAAQVWTDINYLSSAAKERTGYPTQKPVSLAERIIRASSNKGDVVLDPFAGCAYVPVAAEGLGRQWIACDISVRALTVVKRQFAKFRYSVEGGPVVAKPGEEAVLLSDCKVTIVGPKELRERPEREDTEGEPPPPPLDLSNRRAKGQLFSDQEMKEALLEDSDWVCWCCGFANRMDDGEKIREPYNFHLDHVTPKTEGGSPEIWNRAALCGRCNGKKGSREITLGKLREEVEDEGALRVRAPADLPFIPQLQEKAVKRYSAREAERGLV